ncbi:hypothetical protein E5Q_02623, partial [Mixia osmundae IAM 14324]
GALHTTSTISDPCHSSTAALPLQRQGSTPTLLKLSTSAKVNKAQKPSSGLPPPEPAKPCTPLKPRVNRSMPHKRQLRKIESSINNHHPDTKSFIRVLWDECDNEANKDYLRWDGEGLRLLVRLQSTELGQKVLLPHFGHANGASFLRQLNVYTFVRLHRDSLQTVLASNNLLDAPPTDPWSCFFQDDWIRSGGTDNLRKITANSKFARQDPPAHKTRLARINASAKLARVATFVSRSHTVEGAHSLTTTRSLKHPNQGRTVRYCSSLAHERTIHTLRRIYRQRQLSSLAGKQTNPTRSTTPTRLAGTSSSPSE